jgi:sec-independent protein translocase protein TatB
MEILGIGPSELLFIVVIALIILGPKDMQKAGRTIGKWLRSIVTSDGWRMFQQTSRELRTLPNRLMREANDEVTRIGDDINNSISPSLRKEESSSWMKNPNIPARSQPIPASLPAKQPPPSPAVESAPVPDESETQKDG